MKPDYDPETHRKVGYLCSGCLRYRAVIVKKGYDVCDDFARADRIMNSNGWVKVKHWPYTSYYCSKCLSLAVKRKNKGDTLVYAPLDAHMKHYRGGRG